MKSNTVHVCFGDIAFIRRTMTGVKGVELGLWSGCCELRVYPTMPCPCTHHPTSSGSINCACSARCSCQTTCLSYQKASAQGVHGLPPTILRQPCYRPRRAVIPPLLSPTCGSQYVPWGSAIELRGFNLGSAEVRPLRSRHAPEQRFAGEESSQPMVLGSKLGGERLLSSKVMQSVFS